MTDTKKPEHQQKTTQPTPPPKGDEIVNNTSAPLTTEQQKTGNPINLLTLLIAIAGAALGGYSLNQNYAAHSEISNLQITTKQQQQTITELKDQLVTADIDRQKLPDMINQAISLALPTEQLSHEDVQNLVTEQLSKQPKALDQATVQSLINQSLDSLAKGETKIDLSEEIAALKKSEANARAAL
ncbi:MAG: hypothetical protein Q4A74_08825, partial [Cardiobacteriaceae bacterium]|nr:hypothetical protein [Cardiobacteriaceae bacterium]